MAINDPIGTSNAEMQSDWKGGHRLPGEPGRSRQDDRDDGGDRGWVIGDEAEGMGGRQRHEISPEVVQLRRQLEKMAERLDQTDQDMADRPTFDQVIRHARSMVPEELGQIGEAQDSGAQVDPALRLDAGAKAGDATYEKGNAY